MDNNFKIDRPEQIINVRQKDVLKRKEFIGRVKVHPGQTLWELNLATLDIIPVTYDVKAIHLDGSISSDVITKENHLYCVR